jgi:hypothetical protein
MNNIVKTKSKKSLGFTLVEAMVAISILMVAVVSPLTIAQKGLSSAIYSKDQMVASYLAQDAIEYIKYLRDVNVQKILDGDTTITWLEGLGSCSNSCKVDSAKGNVSAIGSGSDKADLYIQKDENGVFVYYTHVSGTNEKSKFRREVSIITSDGVEALIKVKVYWGGSGSSNNSITVKTYIYDLSSIL